MTTINANFGSVFSMAAASFPALLASQILLYTFISDIPGTSIAGDNVAAFHRPVPLGRLQAFRQRSK
jgi:hypothetical protein